MRDYHFRHTPPDQTLDMWRSVRENEEKSIFPYVDACHYRVDSTMAYEIGVLRPYLAEILEELLPHSPHRPYAEDVLRKISAVPPIPSAWIPSDSLYREFI